MEELSCTRAYNAEFHNCHMAQESLRTAMGLKVDNPYDPLKHAKKYSAWGDVVG
jgi:hypothetical protein